VRLELVPSPHGTSLGRAYQQVPVRVLPPFRFGADQPSLLYLLNPTAGLLDGDAQLIEIQAAPGSRAVVMGQSSTRIHPSVGGFSMQQCRLRVRSGAVLAVLLGPAIPFANCRFVQRVDIDLEDGAGLVWGDLWFAGRYARAAASERFRFALIDQEMNVRREGRLVFRDRFRWEGPWDDTAAGWHFGGVPACGSLFATGPAAAETAAAGAPFLTAAGDSCVRWTGASESVTAGVVRAALNAAAALAGASEPWLLSRRDLAPNHWFSPAFM
jgi:urease accessory protein